MVTPPLAAVVTVGVTYLVNTLVKTIVWWGHSRLIFGDRGMAFSAVLHFHLQPFAAWGNPPGVQLVPVLAFTLAVIQGFTGKRCWSVRITVAIVAFAYELVFLTDFYRQREVIYLFGGAGVTIFALLLLPPWPTDLALRRVAELRGATA